MPLFGAGYTARACEVAVADERLKKLSFHRFQHIASAGELVAERLREAAEQGSPEAQNALGEWYQWGASLSGAGTYLCYRWHKKAANQGNEGGRCRIEEFFGYPSREFTGELGESGDGTALAAAMREAGEQWGIEPPEPLLPFDASSDEFFNRLIDAREHEEGRSKPIWSSPKDMGEIEGVETDPAEVLAPVSITRDGAPLAETERPDVEAGMSPQAMLEAATDRLYGWKMPPDERGAFTLVFEAAKAGLPESQYVLGAMYQVGLGTERDEERAWRSYRQAQAAGMSVAGLGLASMAELGHGMSGDAAMVRDGYLEAVEGGQAGSGYAYWGQIEACIRAGRWLEAGPPEVRDPQRALHVYQQVPYSDQRPLFRVGFCYEMGIGTPPDPVKAIELYCRSAKLFDFGYPDEDEREAFFHFGRLYLHGRGVEQDSLAALQLFEVADTAWAAYLGGRMLERGEAGPADDRKALRFYRRAAALSVEAESAHLQFLAYLSLTPGDRAHLATIVEALERAAAEGCAAAQFELAWLGLRGLTPHASGQPPEHFARDAAAQGHLGALSLLALKADAAGRSVAATYREARETALSEIEQGPRLPRRNVLPTTLPSRREACGSCMDAFRHLRLLREDYRMDDSDFGAWLRKRGYRGWWGAP